jgi:hypothetical protein
MPSPAKITSLLKAHSLSGAQGDACDICAWPGLTALGPDPNAEMNATRAQIQADKQAARVLAIREERLAGREVGVVSEADDPKFVVHLQLLRVKGLPQLDERLDNLYCTVEHQHGEKYSTESLGSLQSYRFPFKRPQCTGDNFFDTGELALSTRVAIVTVQCTMTHLLTYVSTFCTCVLSYIYIIYLSFDYHLYTWICHVTHMIYPPGGLGDVQQTKLIFQLFERTKRKKKGKMIGSGVVVVSADDTNFAKNKAVHQMLKLRPSEDNTTDTIMLVEIELALEPEWLDALWDPFLGEGGRTVHSEMEVAPGEVTYHQTLLDYRQYVAKAVTSRETSCKQMADIVQRLHTINDDIHDGNCTMTDLLPGRAYLEEHLPRELFDSEARETMIALKKMQNEGSVCMCYVMCIFRYLSQLVNTRNPSLLYTIL